MSPAPSGARPGSAMGRDRSTTSGPYTEPMNPGVPVHSNATGAVPLVAVTADPLDLPALSRELERAASADGAITSFAGLVRDHNQGRRVSYLEYEAYEPLALRALNLIIEESRALWPTARLGVHHRIGRLEIGD